MNKDAAKIFANEWYERGDEISDYQIFWLTLLRDVFDISQPERLIKFQKPVGSKHIDAYIARTKVLIEHKGFGKDLDQKISQSDEELLTPLEQAQRYADALPQNEKPRWIITCNFAEFRIYDTTKNLFEREPTVIKLRDLRYQFPRLRFLVDQNADDKPPEEKITKDAAKIVEKICLAFDSNYRRREPAFVDALRKFCMRLVFCFYADDAKIFTDKKFGDYLQTFPPEKLRDAIQKFFVALNTPDNQRQNLDDALKIFPYVNGGLFDEKIDIPPLNQNLKLTIERAHIRELRLDEHGKFIKFSWREIDPPVFGAMFESLFKADTQREGGMYYTSVDNIHKVIDPLFLDDLRNDFELAKRRRIQNRPQALRQLQDKIAALTFLDPACGSGNFLTETYLSLRRLENEILEELRGLNVSLPANPVKVSINQFYGIEIEPFAVAVAQTALWIAENQMLQQTEGAIGKNLQALPLKSYATIVKANALRLDWKTVAPNVDFIIGNPPFVGKSFQSREQKADMARIFAGINGYGNLDYVTCWYKKAADFMKGNAARAAFVSTNSVCQGIAVPPLWKNLFAAGVHIDFAHRTFKWLSDSENMAHVHCVVVGFSTAPNDKPKNIFDDGKVHEAANINAYLVDGENIFVEPRDESLREDAPTMIVGSCPTDGGGFIIEANDLDDFLIHEPDALKWIHPYIGSREFINGFKRYCLWLKDCPPSAIEKMPLVSERVEAVKNFRLSSKKAQTRRRADTPTLFAEDRFVDAPALFIPMVSSEHRRYIPMGFVARGIVANNKSFFVPNCDLYTFGTLTSSIHMAWMRTTAGRLKSDYSYGVQVVYNTFPWCSVTARRRQMIEETAQKILDARAKFDGWTFAALYDPQTMPDELRLAHTANDYAVALAYGFEDFWTDEAAVVAELMRQYKALADGREP